MSLSTTIFIFLSTWLLITSTSDLQPSTVIANQLPGQLVSTEIKTIGCMLKLFHHCIDSAQHKNCIQIKLSDCLILYIQVTSHVWPALMEQSL